MMGGFVSREPTDDDVLDAAAQAATLIMAQSNELLTGAVGPNAGVLCPASQVVAGTKYRVTVMLGTGAPAHAVRKFRATLFKPLPTPDTRVGGASMAIVKGSQPPMTLVGDVEDLGTVAPEDYTAYGLPAPSYGLLLECPRHPAGKGLMGGWRKRAAGEAGVAEAAAAAGKLLLAQSNEILLSAEARMPLCPQSQVVAGMNYRFTMLAYAPGGRVRKFALQVHRPLGTTDSGARTEPRFQLARADDLGDASEAELRALDAGAPSNYGSERGNPVRCVAECDRARQIEARDVASIHGTCLAQCAPAGITGLYPEGRGPASNADLKEPLDLGLAQRVDDDEAREGEEGLIGSIIALAVVSVGALLYVAHRRARRRTLRSGGATADAEAAALAAEVAGLKAVPQTELTQM